MILNSTNQELNVLTNELARVQHVFPSSFRLMFSLRISNFFQKNHEAISKLRAESLAIYDAHIEKDEKGEYKTEKVQDGETEFMFRSAQDRANFEKKINELMAKEVRIVI